MKYHSTRNKNYKVSLEQALTQGLSPDGGLFVPEEFPKIDIKSIEKDVSFEDFSYLILKSYFKNSELENNLKQICKKSFSFPLKISKINNSNVVELFHGPTLAFKDFGARFLAQCLNYLNKEFTILTATSGDTGGAVASAFYNLDNIKVGVLYPKNGVSSGQRDQLNYLRKNIHPIAINGSFDDCQKLVKEAFSSELFYNLTSANSINIGRLLAQITYYAYISFKNENMETNFVIPVGNMGNSLACFWAKKMGFNIGKIILVANENNAVKHFFETGELKKMETVKTLANAMDVGLPSNLERLKDFDSIDNLKDYTQNYNVSDEDILKTINNYQNNYGYSIDPHTATVLYINDYLNLKDYYIISTAHPAKFPEIYYDNDLDLGEIPYDLKKCTDNEYKELIIQPDLIKIKKILYNK
jgi:threonine synthase